MIDKQEIILVTGATGRQGGAVLRHLLAAGRRVRALSRNPEGPEARKLEEIGAEVAGGEMGDPDSLRAVLNGVRGVFSVQNFWEHGAAEEVREGTNLAQAAKEAGVAHFVYSSVGGAERHSGLAHFESKWQIEESIRSLQLPSTIFRPVYFMENLAAPQTANEIDQGVLRMGLEPDVKLQMIAVEDIGRFVARAFDDPGTWLGQAVEIAGDALTGPEIGQALSTATERVVRYEQIPMDQLVGINPEMAKMYEWFNRAGYRADIPALRRVLPELMTFDTWVREAGLGESIMGSAA